MRTVCSTQFVNTHTGDIQRTCDLNILLKMAAADCGWSQGKLGCSSKILCSVVFLSCKEGREDRGGK